MRGPRGEDRYRITVRLTKAEYEALRDLKESMGLKTVSDAVRYSINFTKKWRDLIRDIYYHVMINYTTEADERIRTALEQYRARLRRRRLP